MKKPKKTETSSFGTSGRRSHDSSKFYNSKLYKDIDNNKKSDKIHDNEIPEENLNKVYLKSSEDMSELPDNSVHLMITSPPYNVQKEYDIDLSIEEYRALLFNVFSETFRVLVNGGRACVNIANVGRKPYLPLHSYVIEDMLRIGYLMRGEIIWDKSSSAGSSTAWGSWASASNPVLRDVHEYILIFSKGDFSRTRGEKKNTISGDEFLEYTRSIWSFQSESAKKIGHPAPFPLELPRRLIQLYSFEGDVILDPFNGAGTTCVAAIKNNRNFVAYDNVGEYVELANRRIRTTYELMKQEKIQFEKKS